MDVSGPMSYEISIKGFGVSGQTLWGAVHGGCVVAGPDAQANGMRLAEELLSHAEEALKEVRKQVADEIPLLGEEADAILSELCVGCGHSGRLHDGEGCHAGYCACEAFREGS